MCALLDCAMHGPVVTSVPVSLIASFGAVLVSESWSQTLIDIRLAHVAAVSGASVAAVLRALIPLPTTYGYNVH